MGKREERTAPFAFTVAMPQNEHIELFQKRYGKRLDHEEKTRKKEARSVHKKAEYAQKALGIKGKLYAKKRYAEKVQMKKTLAMHAESDAKRRAAGDPKKGAIP